MSRSEDQLSILALYARYNRAIDGGQADEWAGTFVADGVFCHPARDWVGTEGLQRFVTERSAKVGSSSVPEQRHWNNDINVAFGDDQATATCDLLVSGIERGGTAVVVARGRYEDRLLRTADGWRFAERRLTVA